MTALYIALAVLLVIDWRQTLVIAHNPDRFRELNPVLGPHPSVATVHGWFAFAALAMGVVLYGLPEWRLGLAAGFATVEAACVINNHIKGIRP